MKFSGLVSIIAALICLWAKTAKADPQYVQAYFYEFKPTRCNVSLDKFGSASCEVGVISVSSTDRNSVNLNLVGALGHWQLMISNANTPRPQVDLVMIRRQPNTSAKSPSPDHYYTRDNGDIVDGRCSFIPITRKTSGDCMVKIRDGRMLKIGFTTESLSPSKSVESEL